MVLWGILVRFFAKRSEGGFGYLINTFALYLLIISPIVFIGLPNNVIYGALDKRGENIQIIMSNGILDTLETKDYITLVRFAIISDDSKRTINKLELKGKVSNLDNKKGG